MAVHAIDAIDDPRIATYRGVADADLLRAGGRFVAEGRLVVRRLIESRRFEIESVFVTPTALAALADAIDGLSPATPVYVASGDVLSAVAGFNIHRGALAMGRRPRSRPLAQIVPPAPRSALVLAIDGVASADNVGGLIRCARAFGVDAVVAGAGAVDPFYRKAIRTSMGAVFEQPLAHVDPLVASLEALHRDGIHLVALSPEGVALDRPGSDWRAPNRVALVVGHEGHGVSPGVRELCDDAWRVGMVAGIDSVNVVAAAAVALWAVASAMGRLA